jgi:hypothetical protein
MYLSDKRFVTETWWLIGLSLILKKLLEGHFRLIVVWLRLVD